ncbi:hypothetical protein DERP_004990 [Dermatophagoides pteronyssinus]|uniref:Uncharacterized protein n=1 Tax=Dermatophagoides pteronyssinus TaxID=6956 RepID=A0ABQ8JU56_DERPT|nr:hypothetical protein DERP_004990 [Dermatophagoides pteronyssinus]
MAAWSSKLIRIRPAQEHCEKMIAPVVRMSLLRPVDVVPVDDFVSTLHTALMVTRLPTTNDHPNVADIGESGSTFPMAYHICKSNHSYIS